MIKRILKFTMLILIPLLIIAAIYGVMKPLPEGVDYKSEGAAADVELLMDETLHKAGEMVADHEIYSQVIDDIETAEDFIIMDMFLFDDANEGEEDFKRIAEGVTDALVERKSEDGLLDITVITDPVNTMYGSFNPPHLERMEEAGIDVVITDIDRLRDPNPIYSSFYRLIGQWMPQPDRGLIPNFIDSDRPNLTLSGVLQGLNMKANHRKTLVTEKAAIITSWNPHNPSGYHHNNGFRVKGEIQKDVIMSEVAVMNFSGHDRDPSEFVPEPHEPENPLHTTLITERSIKQAILEALVDAGDGDELMIGMFYLADRDVINEIKDAARRGAEIRIILDQNQDAFGAPRPGVPNQPVAKELMDMEKENLTVRWGAVIKEQYHSKFMLIDRADGQSMIIGGNSNWSRRNLENYNLEANLMLEGDAGHEVFSGLRSVYDDQWYNREDFMTLDYEDEKDEALWKRLLYHIQEATGLSNF